MSSDSLAEDGAMENKSQDPALNATIAAKTTVLSGAGPSGPETASAPPEGAGKSRLKLARALQPAADRQTEGRPKAEIRSGETGSASSAGRGATGGLFTTATANAVFLVVIFIMVGLTALDLRANVQACGLLRTASPSGDQPVISSAMAPVPAVPDFAAVLDGIIKDPFFRSGVDPLPGGTNEIHTGEWAIYAAKNLALAARSRNPDAEEAIIFDTEKKITHLLALGQVRRIERWDVTLVSIDDKEAVLTDGIEPVSVRPRASVAAQNP